MSFLDTIKKLFVYNGSDEESDATKNTEDVKPRLNITNPLERAKDMVAQGTDVVKKVTESIENYNKPEFTTSTKDLIYTSLYNSIENVCKEGKPIQEAKLLFKRFLEDQITNEDMYSTEDLVYLSELVKLIKSFNSVEYKKAINDIKEVSLLIIESAYFLNIIETLDITFNLNLMDALCKSSYVIAGHSYLGLQSKNNQCFSINIKGHSFYLMNEVKELITDESVLSFKIEYITKKIKPFFERVITSNGVDISKLYVVYNLFKNLGDTTTVGTVVEEPIVKPEVKEAPVEEVVKTTVQDVIEPEETNVTPVEVLKEVNEIDALTESIVKGINKYYDKDELNRCIKYLEEKIHSDGMYSSNNDKSCLQVLRQKLSMIDHRDDE